MAATSTSKKKRSWLRENWLAVLLCSIVFLVVGGFIYGSATRVSGLELNVRDFRIRQFAFNRDPFTNFQLSGISYTAPAWRANWTALTTSSSIDSQISKHLDSSVPDRWDLVDIDSTIATADAQILITLISARDSAQSDYWKAWSLEQPKKADIFWPAVQTLAKDNLYSEMPRLFQFAIDKSLDVDQFQKAVKDHLAESASLLNSDT